MWAAQQDAAGQSASAHEGRGQGWTREREAAA